MGRILEDKVAVFTGAGRGIGRAVAIRMAREGAKVMVNDYGSAPDGMGSSPMFAEEVVAEIRKENGEAIPNGNTVATAEGGRKIIGTAVESFGRIDIFVNNAGIVMDGMIYNLTEREWDMVVKVNLYGHFHYTRPASKIMKEQKWGRIINMSSGAGFGKTFGCANYAAAKEGVIGFTRAVAWEKLRHMVRGLPPETREQ